MKTRKTPKRRRAKKPDSLRHGPIQSEPTAGKPLRPEELGALGRDVLLRYAADLKPLSIEPGTHEELDAREQDAVLRYAAGLKRLGIEPDALLRDEFLAEATLHQQGYQQGTNIPEALRALVGPRPDIDALDAPSLRRELKLARAHRRFFGDRSPQKARIDLDACAEALHLRPARGTTPKPVFEREIDAVSYATYLVLQEMFGVATGAAEPKENLVDKFLAENRRLVNIEATSEEEAQVIKAASSRARELLLEPALRRQIEAFNTDKEREKKTRLRDPLFPFRALLPSERCALAMWEVLRYGYPAKDEDLDDALKLVRRLQRSFRLVRGRAAKRAKPEKP
jgi:hypothetical protein